MPILWIKNLYNSKSLASIVTVSTLFTAKVRL